MRRALPNLPAFRSPACTKIDANLTDARKRFGRNTSFSLALQNVTNEDYYVSFASRSEPFSGMASVMVRF